MAKKHKPIEGDIIPEAPSEIEELSGDKIVDAASFNQGRTKGRNAGSISQEEIDKEMAHRKDYQDLIAYYHPKDEYWKPTDKERQIVREMAFAGIKHEDIASILGITVDACRYRFQIELRNGQQAMVAEIASSAAFRARSGSDTMAIYLLKVRGGPAFSENRANRDAERAANPELDPQKLSRSQKDALIEQVLEMVKPKAAEIAK